MKVFSLAQPLELELLLQGVPKKTVIKVQGSFRGLKQSQIKKRKKIDPT